MQWAQVIPRSCKESLAVSKTMLEVITNPFCNLVVNSITLAYQPESRFRIQIVV